MKIKKILSVISATLFAVILLASCGSSDVQVNRDSGSEEQITRQENKTDSVDTSITSAATDAVSETTTIAEPAIDLKLPLEIINKTMAGDIRRYLYYIDNNDTLFSTYDPIPMNEWDTDIEITEVANDVRSIHEVTSLTYLYIKKDDTLWGWGSNQSGELGDGTGVDRARDNPVKILDDVAEVYSFDAGAGWTPPEKEDTLSSRHSEEIIFFLIGSFVVISGMRTIFVIKICVFKNSQFEVVN